MEECENCGSSKWNVFRGNNNAYVSVDTRHGRERRREKSGLIQISCVSCYNFKSINLYKSEDKKCDSCDTGELQLNRNTDKELLFGCKNCNNERRFVKARSDLE